jgi:hypothetical protein
MPKMLREMTLIVAGIALGLGLLYLSSLVTYDPRGCGGCSAIGLPSFWTIGATGFGPMLVNWYAVVNDLVFWLAISLTAVELSSHVVLPYVRRELRVSVAKKSTAPTPNTNLMQNPDSAA